MLRNLNELKRYALLTSDGKLDGCRDFLFDDRDWVVRYVVADTRRWLPGRKVLISPMALERPDWRTRQIPVRMTKSEIESSPDLAEDAPVSAAYEDRWHEHYGYSPYWSGPKVASATMRQLVEKEVDEIQEEHLRSLAEVGTYSIRAADGRAGRVADFIVDDQTWVIRYLVVQTGPLLRSRLVLIAPDWVDRVSWADREVEVGLERETLRDSPLYDADAPVNREYESRLYDYHGRPRHWHHGG